MVAAGSLCRATMCAAMRPSSSSVNSSSITCSRSNLGKGGREHRTYVARGSVADTANAKYQSTVHTWVYESLCAVQASNGQ
jgi:hypothetical protein